MNDRAESVCSLLLPGGRILKNEWVCGSIQGGEGDSLKVHLQGSYIGSWRDWATDEHGDLIDLWRASRGCGRAEAFKQVKEFLGIFDSVSKGQVKDYAKAPVKPTTPPAQGGQADAFFQRDRKITRETMDLFRVEVQSEGGRAIIFPCFSPAGELINRSYRTLPKNGEKKKVWQDENCAPCLFGWQALSESAYESRTVLLCEGQIDAMTWHQWGIPALSIPNGSGQTWINYEWDNLAMFDKILIAFDSDDAGRTNAESALQRLGAHRCHNVNLEYPEAKDANAALQKGATSEDAQRWISTARPPQLAGFITGSDMMARMNAEIEVKPMPLTLAFMAVDWKQEKGFYFRPAEVTLWTGGTGNGKSTFLNFLTSTLTGSGRGVFVASMELRPETTLRRTIQSFYGALGQTHDTLTASQYQSWLMEYGDSICFADRVGFIEQDELFGMLQFAFRRYGCTHFIIDSLMRIEGLEENAPAMGKFMNRLQEFAKHTGVHIHLVAHPRKIAGGQRPGAMDIKGSSLIANNADNIVGITRNIEKWELMKAGETSDEELSQMHDTELVVEKQRESGWTGTFYLKFSPRRLAFWACEKKGRNGNERGEIRRV